MNKYLNKISGYVRLVRFRYHITFLVVILGAIFSTNSSFFSPVKPLLIAYISFNVLLYGGLYTLNDIADVKADSVHPKKKNRPLPSGLVSVKSAWIFALVLIILGLTISYYFLGRNIFLMYICFIIVNQFYTRIAKKIPYIEMVVNSFTQPMRFFLGTLLAPGKVFYFLPFVVFLFTFGAACVRRIIEKKLPGWEARVILKYYTEKQLITFQIISLVLIILISFVDSSVSSIWYVIIILVYSVFMSGIHFGNRAVNFYHWLFLNK